MQSRIDSILRSIKKFWGELTDCFRIEKLSKFLVFFENPRMLIWFFVCSCILMIRSGVFKNANIFVGTFCTVVALIFYIAVIFFVSSNIFERILRFSNSIRKIATSTEKERLLPLFKEVYSKAFRKNKNIGRKIKPYIIDTMEVNAYIIGRNTLVITRGALETFNDEEIKGIMAHEFGHLKNYDGQVTLLVKFCTTMFLWIFIAFSFVFSLLEKLFEKNFIGDLFGIVRQVFQFVVKAVLLIWTLLISGGSRHTEYKADMYAKSIGYGEELKSALYQLYHMEISEKKGLTENLKRTHPILAYRIEKLEIN